ncbi:MAG TPA: glycoside hydrolase family 15 protein [Acidimicrobiales bacterium]|nr:glycoside hydrolase family 15 protein [Acidimicrobiales bacterium]
MSTPIEDYALIGDTHTAALVSKAGSIDWLCLPRFDGGACFASLLGDESHGCWQLAPAGGVRRVTRRYRGETLVLETEFVTEDGTVRVVDCMSPRVENPEVVRLVEGVRGRVPMRMQLVIRFDYGSIVPWVRRIDGDQIAVAGPDALWLRSGVRPHGENLTTVAEFTVSEGQRVPFVLSWCPSTEPPPRAIDAAHAVRETEAWWTHWAERCDFPEDSPYRAVALRSLVTLKALTYAPTGGIVAAPTTSLPEQIGGVRNWDYRFCWLRDATFTLWSLLSAGYVDEAAAWRDWLLRAVAGDPADLQIMYGPAGERRLVELELPWLPGYEDSRPVRVGNAAAEQFQLDVYGEVLDAMHQARGAGLHPDEAAWNLERALVSFVEGAWTRPDEGIWEVRGPRRHFTHSKVMAWVAVDRAVKATERFGMDGPADEWRRLRDTIHRDVCEHGYDADQKAFTQSYDSKELDASLLMMPLVGFLPATDDRVRGTIEAIQRNLTRDGFVVRYHEDASAAVDGLPPGEGVFLPCTLWLADNLILLGRTDEARQLFERVVGLTNDVGLLSEEYDPVEKRMVGNFPQAFSHVSLVNTARNLATSDGRAAMAVRAADGEAFA